MLGYLTPRSLMCAAANSKAKAMPPTPQTAKTCTTNTNEAMPPSMICDVQVRGGDADTSKTGEGWWVRISLRCEKNSHSVGI